MNLLTNLILYNIYIFININVGRIISIELNIGAIKNEEILQCIRGSFRVELF